MFWKKCIIEVLSFSAAGICMVSLTGCNAKSADTNETIPAFLQGEQKEEEESKTNDTKEFDAGETEPQTAEQDSPTSQTDIASEDMTTKNNVETEDLGIENRESEMNEETSTDKALQDALSQTGSKEAGSIQNTNADNAARKTAYIAALEDICRDQVFPDGSEFQYDASTNGEGNRFAIYDIDFDGKDELIIQNTTTYTAGMTEIIYEYDSSTDTINEELMEFPELTYYDNGIVEAGWSHNQGLAGLGDFWPYTLYQYEQESDTYVQIASVDAWNKEQADEDYEGNPFPDELDIDGDGFVYFVTAEETYDQDTIVDGEEYDHWRNSLIGGAKKVEIPYQTLNEDNISSLQ